MKNIEELKITMLQNAIKIGKEFNFDLDYSDNSINHVESILIPNIQQD
ncbi:MAG: hypothetical protein NTW25_09735 [Candidatus Kapabacteria bacterium]|nr:hypothetical protein [Candidatus Kapabacteria bacterium]